VWGPSIAKDGVAWKPSLPSADLVVAAASSRHDLDAFAVLYDRYAERLLDYFTRRTVSEDTALELCAETLSRAWVSRKRFEDQHDGTAAPWLYGIARNVLLMSIRRGAVEQWTRPLLHLKSSRGQSDPLVAVLALIATLASGPARAAPW
jgi:DNA-directed RNA polymerase specialized sigma24 family protein